MATPTFDPMTFVPPQVIVNELLLPPITGAVLGLLLCGMCFPRLLDYYSNFPQDSRRNKLAVAIVGLGILGCTVMLLVYVITTGSRRVHTIVSLYTSYANTSLFPIAAMAIDLPTHLILAERAWKLNGDNRLLGACLGLLVLSSFVGSILSAVYTFLAKEDVLAYGSAMYIMIPATFIVYLITDLAIVICTLVGLHRYSRTFLVSTQDSQGFGGARLIRSAWQTSVESAVFPTCLNVISIALHYSHPTGLRFATPSFMIPPVYCLTLLFSLERRQAHIKASRFRSCLPTVTTHRDGRPMTTNVESSVKVMRNIEGAIAVTFVGEGRCVETQTTGLEVIGEQSYSS